MFLRLNILKKSYPILILKSVTFTWISRILKNHKESQKSQQIFEHPKYPINPHKFWKNPTKSKESLVLSEYLKIQKLSGESFVTTYTTFKGKSGCFPKSCLKLMVAKMMNQSEEGWRYWTNEIAGLVVVWEWTWLFTNNIAAYDHKQCLWKCGGRKVFVCVTACVCGFVCAWVCVCRLWYGYGYGIHIYDTHTHTRV